MASSESLHQMKHCWKQSAVRFICILPESCLMCCLTQAKAGQKEWLGLAYLHFILTTNLYSTDLCPEPGLLVWPSVAVLCGLRRDTIPHVYVLLAQFSEGNLRQISLDWDLSGQHLWPELLHHCFVFRQDSAGNQRQCLIQQLSRRTSKGFSNNVSSGMSTTMCSCGFLQCRWLYQDNAQHCMQEQGQRGWQTKIK